MFLEACTSWEFFRVFLTPEESEEGDEDLEEFDSDEEEDDLEEFSKEEEFVLFFYILPSSSSDD